MVLLPPAPPVPGRGELAARPADDRVHGYDGKRENASGQGWTVLKPSENVFRLCRGSVPIIWGVSTSLDYFSLHLVCPCVQLLTHNSDLTSPHGRLRRMPSTWQSSGHLPPERTRHHLSLASSSGVCWRGCLPERTTHHLSLRVGVRCPCRLGERMPGHFSSWRSHFAPRRSQHTTSPSRQRGHGEA